MSKFLDNLIEITTKMKEKWPDTPGGIVVSEKMWRLVEALPAPKYATDQFTGLNALCGIEVGWSAHLNDEEAIVTISGTSPRDLIGFINTCVKLNLDFREIMTTAVRAMAMRAAAEKLAKDFEERPDDAHED